MEAHGHQGWFPQLARMPHLVDLCTRSAHALCALCTHAHAYTCAPHWYVHAHALPFVCVPARQRACLAHKSCAIPSGGACGRGLNHRSVGRGMPLCGAFFLLDSSSRGLRPGPPVPHTACLPSSCCPHACTSYHPCPPRHATSTHACTAQMTFVGPGFTRKPPKYERFIRPTGKQRKPRVLSGGKKASAACKPHKKGARQEPWALVLSFCRQFSAAPQATS